MATFNFSGQKPDAVSPQSKTSPLHFFPAHAKVPFFQTKLTVGPTDDVYEREADAVAEKVMRMEDDGQIQAKLAPIEIQRKCAECDEEEEAQRKDNGAKSVQTEAPSLVSEAINSPGTPLPEGDRSFMEERFGYDFGDVSIHTNDMAAKSARAINALAYTSGNNVVFNEGQFAPGTESGKKLLAHELTHVIQQNSDIRRKGIVQRQEEMDEAVPLQTGPSQLRMGQVIRVEVRSSGGDIEPMTHNYPVAPNGCVILPMLGCVIAAGKTTTQLRADIERGLTNGFFRSPTVNVSLVSRTVNYGHIVAAGESIFIRVLGSDGSVEFQGDFPVDSTGQIHIPMVGNLNVQNQNFSVIESTIRSRMILGEFLRDPTVHVADSRI